MSLLWSSNHYITEIVARYSIQCNISDISLNHKALVLPIACKWPWPYDRNIGEGHIKLLLCYHNKSLLFSGMQV